MNININAESLKLYSENLIKEICLDADQVNISIAENSAKTDILSGGRSYNSSYTLNTPLPLSDSFIKSIICGRSILDAVGIYPPYGTLGGVRPFKSAVIMKNSGMDERAIYNVLTNIMKIAPEKAELIIQVANFEISLARSFSKLKDPFGLYISIPFCPTRCRYCSFISSAAPNQLKTLPIYLDALYDELSQVKMQISESDMTLTSIYIGGGTPTVMNEKQLKTLMTNIRCLFSDDVEFTLEAGRPDTINDEKLNIAESFGVNRISINCQSLNDNTLASIGRNHTKADYLKAMQMVKKRNFRTVNTDIIAGFEEETAQDFEKTVSKVIELSPENITVHSLCLKKASDITGGHSYLPQSRNIDDFINFSHKSCILAKYQPYYMYRQKYSAGNHENTGYSKAGHECIYNTAMMGELISIFGVGAGAATKIINNGEKISSSYNCKYPSEYIERRKNKKE